MELVFHHPVFEAVVRSTLNIYERPITDADARTVTELDLSQIYCFEELETLSYFQNLTFLDISTRKVDSRFWQSFPKLAFLYWDCLSDSVDFECFRDMHGLRLLLVSGGDISDADYWNLDALVDLENLEHLVLHEFGSVDITPLCAMKQLKFLELAYANRVENIQILGQMQHLEALTLYGLTIEDLDFLDWLPDEIQLDLCGLRVRHDVDIRKYKRFSECEISEISVNGQYWEYIDLSVLED